MSGFRSPYSTPTDEQAALIGHIVMDWAIVESNLRHLMRRLAMTPELPGRIVTERTTAAIAETKIGALLELHEQRYRDQIIKHENRLAIKAAMAGLSKLRKKRNVFAHNLCIRFTDDDLDIFCLDRALPENSGRNSGHSLETLRDLQRQIRQVNEGLEAAISLIPAQAERLSPE